MCEASYKTCVTYMGKDMAEVSGKTQAISMAANGCDFYVFSIHFKQKGEDVEMHLYLLKVY